MEEVIAELSGAKSQSMAPILISIGDALGLECIMWGVVDEDRNALFRTVGEITAKICELKSQAYNTREQVCRMGKRIHELHKAIDPNTPGIEIARIIDNAIDVIEGLRAELAATKRQLMSVDELHRYGVNQREAIATSLGLSKYSETYTIINAINEIVNENKQLIAALSSQRRS